MLRAAARHVRVRDLGRAQRQPLLWRATGSARSRCTTRRPRRQAGVRVGAEVAAEVPGLRRASSTRAVDRTICVPGYVAAPRASIFDGVASCRRGTGSSRGRRADAWSATGTLDFGPKRQVDEAGAEAAAARAARGRGARAAGERRAVRRVPERRHRLERRRRADGAKLAEPVKTFSIGFRRGRVQRDRRARLVARHFGTEHHELVVDPDAVESAGGPGLALRRAVRRLLGDSDVYRLEAGAREHVKVVLLRRRRRRAVRRLRALSQVPAPAERCAGARWPRRAAARAAGSVLPGARGVRLQRIGSRLSQAYPDALPVVGRAVEQDDFGLVLAVDIAGEDPTPSIRHHFVDEGDR